jgi:hypothetical protein
LIFIQESISFSAPDPRAFSSAVGRRGNLPFLPGGFEDELDAIVKQSEVVCEDEEQKFLEFKGRF